jgi:hypothetical protein
MVEKSALTKQWEQQLRLVVMLKIFDEQIHFCKGESNLIKEPQGELQQS